MHTMEILRRFSKTPLKHRMSKYLLEYILEQTELLARIVFVNTRHSIPNIMIISQAEAEGPAFELELGAIEREEVSLVNGRLVKQTKRIRANWIHDPVQAVECLRRFSGILHIQLIFSGKVPDWYEHVAVDVPLVSSDFARIVQNQLELALEIIVLKAQIDKALAAGDKEGFLQMASEYRKLSAGCLWDL